MSKVEVVKQQDLKDCGACCLLCLIKYYHGYVPLEKIREDTYTSNDGTTAYHLVKAAQKYGFEAFGVKVDNITDENIYFPAIAHVVLKNGLNHFVVVSKITKNQVFLMDPAKGNIKLTYEEFNEIWDNILILLNPISNIIKMNKKLTIFKLFQALLIKNKSIFTQICFVNFILMFLFITSSFYFQTAVSSINHQSDLKLLKFIILLFGFFTIFKIIFNYLKDYYLNYFHKNLDVEIFTSFLSHLFNLPLKYTENRTTGEIISRVEELSEIKTLLSEIFSSILLNSVLVIGSIVALYFINAKLFFLLCFIISIYIFISLIFSKVIYQNIEKNIDVATEFNTTLVENINLINSMKNLNLVKEFYYHLENKLILMLKTNFNFNTLLNKINLFKNSIYDLGLFFITTYGFYLISQSKLELLSLITFNSLLLYLFDPIKEMLALIPKYHYIKASFNKLSEFLNLDEEVDEGINLPIDKINVQNLSYSYNNFTNILTNLSFEVKPHSQILLSGPSGSGKSTICKLLYKTLSEYQGDIKLGNLSEKDLSLKCIRQDILYINQEESLFTGTIKENILCFRSIPDSFLLDILKICKVDEIIAKRPNRLETMINASLNNLSGGERQRIILARGLLKNAKVIILDEALSEVNLQLEKEIIENIKNYFPSSILIYVSHKDVADKFSEIISVGASNG